MENRRMSIGQHITSLNLDMMGLQKAMYNIERSNTKTDYDNDDKEEEVLKRDVQRQKKLICNEITIDLLYTMFMITYWEYLYHCFQSLNIL